MNGFSSADMSTAAANGFRDGLAAQSAESQEAVAWQRRYAKLAPDGSRYEWHEISREQYLEAANGKWASAYELRELYTAPVAAAPVDALDTGNLCGGPLYLSLDALYQRGWTDLHQKRKNDPRGAREWQYVHDLFRAGGARTPEAPEGFGSVSPVDHVRYWAEAYGSRASGPHFQGHGKVHALLTEYADLLERLAGRPQGVKDRPPIDGCTESNCKRCRTHPNHRGDMEHAGIGWRQDSPQEASDA